MLALAIKETDEYKIERCAVCDIELLMLFFADQWDKNHVIAKSKEFIDQHFFNKSSGTYNFLIAKRKPNMELIGILGYIPNFYYDKSISSDNKFIWITNWLTKKNNSKFSGLELLIELSKHENCSDIGIIGLSEYAKCLYKLMKYDVGKMDHYFIVNDSKSEFLLLKGYIKKTKSYSSGENSIMKKIQNLSEIQLSHNLKNSISNRKPTKTIEFIKNKYLDNPYYDYQVYGVFNPKELISILVLKLVKYEDSTIIRIVDFIGEDESLYGLYIEFQKLLKQYDAEYLDFYVKGMKLEDSCFELKEEQGAVVLPNYYEPYKDENITIDTAFKISGEYRIFKGDGDREHPRSFEIIESAKKRIEENYANRK